MMSPSDTLPEEEEGADVDEAKRDGAKREGGAIESDCLHWNYASMAHMTEKWSKEGKGTEKWHKIFVIVEGKMSISRDADYEW